MADREGDKSKQPPECRAAGRCPHVKTVSETWDTETLECAVCGQRYTLYDEEMR